MKRSIVCFIILTFFAAGAFAQPQKKNPSRSKPPTTIDPFDIKRGSSFSASVSNPEADFKQSGATRNRKDVAEDLAEALGLIRANHVNGKNANIAELTKTSIESMLHALDPHSNFYNQREFDELLTDQRSEYIGIGVTLENFTKDSQMETYVTSVFPGSPASRADLRFGDRIVSVDGESASGLDAFAVREKIRGVRETKVRLVVERAKTFSLETIELRRTSVRQSSVPDAYMLRKGIGYVDLTRGFNYSTGNEFRTAVSGLRAQGMNALILDLRDNPGGIVEQAVRTAETFLPAGTVIVSQRGRSDFDNRIWKSQNTAPENVPLVVLVDSGSASASEILAGALQDNDRALLVGEKTFGKGLVQSVMNLPFGNGLTLTTARYYTPTGRSIQRDYSNGDLYGYYRHEATEQSVRGFFAVKTASGRTVYGGDGITPDFTVRSPIQDQTQSLLRDPIFFFSVEVLAGRIPGLDVSEDLLSTVGHARTDTLLVDYENKIIGALREYLRKTDSFNGSNEEIDKNKHFIAMQIHYQLVAAKSGRVQANRIRMEDDLQIAKAVDAIPHANNLLKTKSPQASAKRQSRRAKL